MPRIFDNIALELLPALRDTLQISHRSDFCVEEFWSARELARVLDYPGFRKFTTVMSKVREACAQSGHAVSETAEDVE